MKESEWICERCERKFDLEKGEGEITLVDDERYAKMGKLTPSEPYECVCYECADELLALAEKCNSDCGNCDVTLVWGLSIMDCLRFQVKFDLLDLPEKEPPPLGSIEEAKEVLRILKAF